MNRRDFIASASMAMAGTMAGRLHASETEVAPDSTISIDLSHATGSLPHFWEKAAGSDRAAVGLRDQWRQDLVRVHRDTGIESVRFHGLFDDEMGIAAAGPGNFNFLYVDQLYDFMLDHGVRPFVELSFMPEAFATSANTIFAYRGNLSVPRKWNDWHDMVQAFTRHCVQRYGLAEVSGWKFEVWNEPNIGFWAGTQAEYFEMFRQSASAIKSVSDRLQVGGPASAQLGWIPDLIHYCAESGVPLDFISSHIYPDDPQGYIFGKEKMYSFEQVIPRGVELVKKQIEASRMPHLPLWITEWSSQNPAFIADTLKNCIGLVEAMSYWTFSNVFEEGGVPSGIFNSSYGMTDQWGIPRPSLHAFTFFHKLGDTRLQCDEGPVLATRHADGSAAILLWNLIPASSASDVANGNPIAATAGGSGQQGSSRTYRLRFKGLKNTQSVAIRHVNDHVGSAIPKWKQMGSPKYPSKQEIEQLRSAAELPRPQDRSMSPQDASGLVITVPPNGLALIEISNRQGA